MSRRYTCPQCGSVIALKDDSYELSPRLSCMCYGSETQMKLQ